MNLSVTDPRLSLHFRKHFLLKEKNKHKKPHFLKVISAVVGSLGGGVALNN